MSMPISGRDMNKRKLIFEGEGWLIYEHENKNLSLTAKHIVCAEDSDDFEPEWSGHSFYLEDMYVDNGGLRVGCCYGCGGDVPESIQALMILHSGWV